MTRRRYPRMASDFVVPAPGPFVHPDEQVFRNADTEDPMPKIQFTSVQLHKTVPRLDAGIGQATQDTTFFDVARARVAIEYDPATQLVRISKGTAAVYIPLAGVERFGPTVDDARAAEKAREDAATANANA